ncbi:adenylate/guanylate cyclase [Reticulomyxa filosa]|uniref:Adenylate/guanylate cyclase n=1 Tax=Reticulomyxa filosa TaxID=46433 RepID=X6MVC2_RETFI|nr:adenylate/guanylate cyclase [Reticulomyxa filosa]|eukprot:ETO17601.1 adenylate/guanylate cyclase [Reticulomyxa filosa]
MYMFICVYNFFFLLLVEKVALFLRALACISIITFGIIFWSKRFEDKQVTSMMWFNIFLVGYSLVISALGQEPGHGIYIVLMFCCHLLSGMGHIRATAICTGISVSFSVVVLWVSNSPNSPYVADWNVLVKSMAFLVGTTIFLAVMGIFLEFGARRQFVKKQVLQVQKQKSWTALSTLLPPNVARALQQSGKRVAFRNVYNPNAPSPERTGVCVLFCQICEFHHLVATLRPAHLVKVLNDVFTYWDLLTEHYKIFKVETINEIYMAAAGLPHPETDENDLPAPSRIAMYANKLMYESDHVLEIEVDDVLTGKAGLYIQYVHIM